MPDIWVHGVLHHDISWDEARRLAGDSEPERLNPEDAERLGRKMQEQAEASAAMAAAGVSIYGLPIEEPESDESVPVDDLAGREYDWEGALADLRAREAGET